MNTALLIIGALLLLFVGLNLYARSKMKNMPLEEDHDNILVLNDKNFQPQLKNKLVLVDFWAAWCAPCRMMAPVLNEVAAELSGNQKVGKVDIEKYQSLAQQFKVRSIPTLILFKNGKEVDRFVGIKQKKFLIDQINKQS